MGLKFKKTESVDEVEQEPPFDPDEKDEQEEPKAKKSKFGSSKAKAPEKEAPKKSGFLKTGKARKAAMEEDEVRAEQRKQEYGKLWRFFIPIKQVNEDFTITFLDGELDDEGTLDNPVYYEHNIKVGSDYKTFVSCCDEEVDPLQEAGQEPYLAQAFTIIDHTEYTDKEGKVHKHRKKLLVAKRRSMKQLQKLATRQGGLKGCTFIVTRTGDKAVNIGDMYDFDSKSTMKELKEALVEDGVKEEDVADLVSPADYEAELTYYTADELVKLGYAERSKTISSREADAEAAEEVDSHL